jgi:4-hydroxy-tetrahydrodipicolinate reductase
VVENLHFCLERNIPVVCGTTGWLHHKPEIEQLAREKGSSFFYASNYSIGVNLFFRLNKLLATWMNDYPQYQVTLTEIHHTEKKDAPSGTAITLAEGVLTGLERKSSWVNSPSDKGHELVIHSLREQNVPGTHTVQYDSSVDRIEITHTAYNREGFGLGAVVAAEWLVKQAQTGKSGAFGMEDMLGEMTSE